MISIVAAMAENNAIGKDQQLLWHLPSDLKRFKELTKGHAIVMGRKTFESLPKGALPNRTNIILTTTLSAGLADVVVCSSLPEALAWGSKGEELFIIGGAQVYKQALDMADKMYLTRVHHTFADADTYFPEIDFSQWIQTEHHDFPADQTHPYAYSFLTYERKSGR